MLALGIIDLWLDGELFCGSAALCRADATRWIVRALMHARGWRLDPDPDPDITVRWDDLPPSDPAFLPLKTLMLWQALPESWLTSECIHPLTCTARWEFFDILYGCCHEESPWQTSDQRALDVFEEDT